MSETPTSPNDPAIIEKQNKHAAELFLGGAVWRNSQASGVDPVLRVTDEQLVEMQREKDTAIRAKKREKFLKSTPEGTVILDHKGKLHDLADRIRMTFLHQPGALQNPDGSLRDTRILTTDIGYLADNDLSIPNELTLRNSSETAWETVDRLRGYSEI